MMIENGVGVIYVPKHTVDPATRSKNPNHPDCERGFIYFENRAYGEKVPFVANSRLPVRYFHSKAGTNMPPLRTTANSEMTDVHDLLYDRLIPKFHIKKCFDEISKANNIPERLEAYRLQNVMETWEGMQTEAG